jgi:hypothetical protein
MQSCTGPQVLSRLKQNGWSLKKGSNKKKKELFNSWGAPFRIWERRQKQK